ETVTRLGGVVATDDDSGLAVYRLTYDREDGTQDIVDIGIEELVKLHETVTQLGGVVATDDDSGLAVYRLTYDREDGTQDIVDIGIENGLQIDESSGTIKLGGKLTEKTTIETDADNTLAIDGLEAGGTEEGRILMLDANNVVKTVSSNKFVRFFYMPSVIFDTSILNPTGPRYE